MQLRRIYPTIPRYLYVMIFISVMLAAIVKLNENNNIHNIVNSSQVLAAYDHI